MKYICGEVNMENTKGLPQSITASSVEGTNPYQEQRDQFGKGKFQSLIVFGQGPVKPVLIIDELTTDQLSKWQEFKRDPLHSSEPDFRIVEGGAYLSELKRVDERQDITETDKEQLKEKKREEWQNLGRFALNRWGRQNALASGLALYLGVTDNLILSGGKTIPSWAGEVLPTDRVNAWPSEAQLMQDIIVRRFGDLYQSKYGKPIEDAIRLEDRSTNTLENFAYTINNNPNILQKDEKIGLLAADFHLRRAALLAHLFSVSESSRGQLSAQELLKERAEIRGKDTLVDMQNYLRDALNNPDLRQRLLGEERWERGLVDESFLAYWVGYLADVQNPTVVQQVMNSLKDDKWAYVVRSEFVRADLNFDEFSNEDLEKLKDKNPEKYEQLIAGLAKFKSSLRKMPPPIKA